MTDKNDIRSDHEIFMNAMKDVVPLKAKLTINLHKPKIKTRSKAIPLEDKMQDYPILSDHCTIDVLPEQYLSFVKTGVQTRQFKKLRQGKITIDAVIDLHGDTVDVAKKRLLEFLKLACSNGYTCVQIIHGKGYQSQSKIPILKNKVYTWLLQHEDILAFCSSLPKDGGTGSVYVLLKRIR